MAARKKTTTRKKPQYVRAKKRKGAEPPALARRSFSIGVLVVALAAFIFGVFKGFEWINRKLFAANPRFEIQHLVISSDGKLGEDRIREYTGLREGTNLFAVAFEDVENELAKVPVIESVYLERKLPHTLVVKVKERVPVARISGQKVRRYPFVVDRYGYVLPPRASASALPHIMGLDEELRLGSPAENPDVETALKIIALCDSSGYLRSYVNIESLDVKYSDFIYLHLRDGARARIPRYSLEPRLLKLASVIKIAKSQGKRVKEADVTLDTTHVPTTFY